MKKPLVLITAGDPLGIGPEITVRALQNLQVRRSCTPVVIGEPTSLLRAGWTDKLGRLIAVESIKKLPTKHAPSRVGGAVSFQAVKLGIKLSLQHHVPLVTAPISKQSWTLADVPFTGHTELLRHATQSDGLMMFVSEHLRCALVTEHFALAHLPLSKKRVEETALHFCQALKNLGIKTPKIGLCAVNPHAADNGKFGTEENEILRPAIKNLRRKGLKIEGPIASDAAWLAHLKGQYDGLLCTYHDQALLGLKLAAKKPIVHLTAGLPFLRTSPAHGTAFDIAGKKIADPQSMVSAILFAVKKN
ncbi:PdxA family dehydrogenase [Candidatus Avelusimicrobium luingense]|uniref:PdxA family dehydrogenase n=1 Tax=Candidatus Avelusimicrobium luingense TaxID=3416211 RepID=UPI003D13B510